jgi:5-deoxy-glucuronate isomerase
VTAAAQTTPLPPFVPRGSTASKTFALEITPEAAGWGFSGLRVLELPAGGRVQFDTGPDELIVLPLSGGCRVDSDGVQLDIAGRASVFSRVTDFGYVPRDAQVVISSVAGGRFALPSARADRRLSVRYGPAEDVPVELRGAGQASRQVNNFCSPEAFDADRLIAVEVLTPGGNWSSYPPHKHDRDSATESALEEIYYFELTASAGSPDDAPDGLAYQRVYGSGPQTGIDICAEVGSGDVVLVPHGYHGPSMAAPGFDLYYLNVMAGPAERAWRFCDDPSYSWIRDSWTGLDVDARLPLTSPTAAGDTARERRE